MKPPFKLRDEAPRLSQIGCLQEEAKIAPARGTPLLEATSAAYDSAADPLLQSAPPFEFDHRLAW
jgi:hypothetical protein